MPRTTPQILLEGIKGSLKDLYSSSEIESLAYIILEHCVGIDMKKVILNDELIIKPQEHQEVTDILNRLQTYEPIQYIIGYAYFYNRRFQVNRLVLIPRPETEEMVQLIIKDNPEAGLKILDIGTGSGCIAITLQLELSAQLFGCDISEQVLKLAEHNAMTLGALITFSQCDILHDQPAVLGLDVIVSNPPYVRLSEKEHMKANVLDYEPELSLFVSDKEPLIFYERIADLSRGLLKPGGKIYFEINEKFGKEMKDLLYLKGYNRISIRKDFRGKDRFVIATWPPQQKPQDPLQLKS